MILHTLTSDAERSPCYSGEDEFDYSLRDVVKIAVVAQQRKLVFRQSSSLFRDGLRVLLEATPDTKTVG